MHRSVLCGPSHQNSALAHSHLRHVVPEENRGRGGEKRRGGEGGRGEGGGGRGGGGGGRGRRERGEE